MKLKGTEARREASGPDSAEAEPKLPSEKAFVVQLTSECEPTLRPFAGRVEHLSTGRRMRFGRLEEFLAALSRLLREAPRS